MRRTISIKFFTGDIEEKKEEIARLHQKAFGGYPWFVSESEEEVLEEINSVTGKRGSKTLFAYTETEKIVGLLMYDTPTDAQLLEERGDALLLFTKKLMKENTISSFIWEREVFVHPDFYGMGIATKLRTAFIQHLQKKLPSGVIILTRMWDKNPAIIHVAKKFDFQRTGITIRSVKIDAEYEYWYKIIKKRN